MAVVTTATLTCPTCGYVAVETMPSNACQYFYECHNCHVLLQPSAGDCCVFCSYADQTCPPVQMNGRCCATESSGSPSSKEPTTGA